MSDFNQLFASVVNEYLAEGYPHNVIGQWTLPENDVRDLLETVRQQQPRNVLEVGTFVGLSTMLMALAGRADARVTSVDPNFPLNVEMGSMGSNLGQADAGRKTQEIARAVSRRLGIEDRVQLVAGGFASGETFASRRTEHGLSIPIVGPDLCKKYGPFDLIFIDGLHYANVVEADLDLAARHLAPGGSIVLHDCIGMWGTNVRSGISRFLTHNPEWQLLHHPFNELYRSIGIVFRVEEHSDLKQQLLSKPAVSDRITAQLKALATSLIDRLRPNHVIELTAGDSILGPYFANMVTTDVIAVHEDAANRLSACISEKVAVGIAAEDILIVSAGALDVTEDRNFSHLLDVISQKGALAALLRTPPGERAASCRHSRPLRRWVRMADAVNAKLWVGNQLDLATNTFHLVASDDQADVSTSLTSLVLITSGKSASADRHLEGFYEANEDVAEALEQQQVLDIHYGAGIRRLALERANAFADCDTLRLEIESQRLEIESQKAEILEMESHYKTIADHQVVIDGQNQVIGMIANRALSDIKRCLVTARTVGRTILDACPDVVVEDALAHAFKHGHRQPCLMLSWTKTGDALDELLQDPRIGLIGIKDSEPSLLATDQAADSRIGRYFHDGRWMLPPDVRTVYFIGPLRLLTPAMIATAWRANVENLYTRAGTHWLRVPMHSLYRLYGCTQRAKEIASSVKSVLTNQLAKIDTARVLPAKIQPYVMSCQEAFDASLALAKPRDDFHAGRAVLVCGNLSPGGAERQVVNTLIGLKQNGIDDVHLLAHHLQPGRGQMDFHLKRLLSANITAREIDTAPDYDGKYSDQASILKALPSGLALDISNLVREFERLKPEVVHAWLDWDSVRAGIAAAIAGVPKIFLSGRNLAPYNFKLYQSYMKPAYRSLAKLENVRFLNNSHAGANDYADWIGIPRDRIAVINNGFFFDPQTIATAAEKNRRRQSIGIDDGTLLVGGIFRLEDEKRPLLWIESAIKIAESLPNVQFIIYGQGSMLEHVKSRIAGSPIDGRITLAGITQTPLDAMSLMDVFLLTSYGEGLPNVLIEAQSVGTPVVCTDVGGAAEAVKNTVTGSVINSDDACVIANAVIHLLNDQPLRDAMGIAAQEFVRHQFGLQRMIEETLAVYDLSPAPSKRNVQIESTHQ